MTSTWKKYMYKYMYKGKEYQDTVYATSLEDAKDRIGAIRFSGEVNGRILLDKESKNDS